MSLAPQELENTASKFAAEAISFDSRGSRGMAIQSYQRAIDALVKLVQIYPEYRLNRVYRERANAYQNRIRTLQLSSDLKSNTLSRTISPSTKDFTRQDSNQLRNEGKSRTSQSNFTHQVTGSDSSTSTSSDTTFDDLVLKEKPHVKWGEVIGLDDAKRAIRESIVYPTKRSDLFPLGWPRGILLFGPPGCGKTLLAAAAAAEIDGYFLNVDAASMMSKWLGEAEKNVSKLFMLARRLQENEGVPVLLFIDEIDSLLGTRTSEIGGEVRVKNQFLTEMDGINVTLPSLPSRVDLFRQYTRPLNREKSLKPDDLAKLCEGYSASDIKDICQAAQLRVVNELFESGMAMDTNSNPRSISAADFKEIFKVRKPSVSAEMLKAYIKWSDQFKAL